MERWLAHVTVATVIEHDGRFLCVRETRNGQQLINQPAGHVERGETLLTAAMRETFEETGLACQIAGLLGVYVLHREETYYRFCFAATADHPATPPRPRDSAIDDAIWLSADEIRAAKAQWRSPLVGAALEDYLAGKRLPVDGVQELFA